MKIIHCADIHLDSKLNANLTPDKARERRQELLSTFVRMVDYADTNDVTAVLICGDLFDTANISALSRNTVKDAIVKHPVIDFYLLKGNHDSDAFINSFEDIPDNLKLFSDHWTAYETGSSGNIVIHGVELDEENSRAAQNGFSPDPQKINIVMLHGQQAETVSKDKAEVIDLKLFRNKGINYLALGHVHEYKCEPLDAYCKYCYPGCLEGRGFDETGDHGFVLLNVNEDTGEVSDRFVSFAYRHVYEVPVDVSGLSDSPAMLEAAERALAESGAEDIDLVKVVLTGDVDVECEKDPEFIRKSVEDDYYFIKVYDKTRIKVDPATYMYDTSLKGEFVRKVLEREDLSDEEKGEIVRMGLEALMGGSIVL
ncbi:MAG: metallophosphoesterase [Lachnospiraceae bacterium]|nr:metallophosphoesterase [Lachnospiraceae bacterium]